jgi:hypothetical protein
MQGGLRFLKFVLESPSARRRSIISKNKQVVKHICDILLNILLQNISVKASVINKLKRHRKVIYTCVNKKTSDKTRKELLLRHPSILKTLATLLPSINKTLENEPLYQNVFNQ